jgi:hypothetical protein
MRDSVVLGIDHVDPEFTVSPRAARAMKDEPYTPFSGRLSEPTMPTLIHRVWRVRHPRSGKILSCGQYQHPYGVEVRCGYQDGENLLWSQVVKPPDDGRALAAEWKQMVIEKGYEELPLVEDKRPH